jgi:hypothetical protein
VLVVVMVTVVGVPVAVPEVGERVRVIVMVHVGPLKPQSVVPV